nr:histidine kinase [Kineococcus vitellinus]
MADRWRAADDLRRVELYTRWSLQPLVFLAPFLVVAFSADAAADAGARPPAGAGLAAAVAGSCAQAAAVAVLVGRAVDGKPWGRRLPAAWAGTSVLALLTAVLAFDGGVASGSAAGVAAVTAAAPLGRHRFRRYAPVAAAIALVASAAAALAADGWRQQSTVGVSVGLHVFYAVLAPALLQMSLWLVEVVRRLAAAERDRARLAVAEERLRFARDLHDVVGRDLSAIAVTSDLVAELARRGRPEAADKAVEVREIAQGSLEQIRAVVRGYRAVDLQQELDGSVALLRSAGVQCTVRDDSGGAPLPAEVRSAAAWVIREGVTNVVRHSAATWCRISLLRGGAGLEVRLENDGATAAEGGRGSGLAGLAERLRPLGGDLDVRHADGTFELSARLEVPA